jgi:hypothetical protein
VLRHQAGRIKAQADVAFASVNRPANLKRENSGAIQLTLKKDPLPPANAVYLKEVGYTLFKPAEKVWLEYILITHRKIVLIASTVIFARSAISQLRLCRISTESES